MSAPSPVHLSAAPATALASPPAPFRVSVGRSQQVVAPAIPSMDALDAFAIQHTAGAASATRAGSTARSGSPSRNGLNVAPRAKDALDTLSIAVNSSRAAPLSPERQLQILHARIQESHQVTLQDLQTEALLVVAINTSKVEKNIRENILRADRGEARRPLPPLADYPVMPEVQVVDLRCTYRARYNYLCGAALVSILERFPCVQVLNLIGQALINDDDYNAIIYHAQKLRTHHLGVLLAHCRAHGDTVTRNLVNQYDRNPTREERDTLVHHCSQAGDRTVQVLAERSRGLRRFNLRGCSVSESGISINWDFLATLRPC